MTPIILIATVASWVSGCSGRSEDHGSEYFETAHADRLTISDDPLALIVEIGPGGKLSLNRIETGTLADVAALSDKIRVVFEDRKRTGVAERKVYVFSTSRIDRGDLEDLIEKLTETDAMPILVVE